MTTVQLEDAFVFTCPTCGYRVFVEPEIDVAAGDLADSLAITLSSPTMVECTNCHIRHVATRGSDAVEISSPIERGLNADCDAARPFIEQPEDLSGFVDDIEE